MTKSKKTILVILGFVVGPVVLALAAFLAVARLLDPQMDTTMKICASAQEGRPLDARNLVAQNQEAIGEVRISNADQPNVDLTKTTEPLPKNYDFFWSGPGLLPVRCFVEVRDGTVKTKLTNRF